MPLITVILLLISFTSARGAESYSSKLQPLLACYETWCGEEWGTKSKDIRYSERPSRAYCRGSTGQVTQDGMKPTILPPDSLNSLKFTLFLNGNAYSCDAGEVAQPTCLDKNPRFQPCGLEEKWDFITFSIPSSNIGTKKNLDLRMTRKPAPSGEYFEFNRAVGDLETHRNHSKGKTVCQLDNSVDNGRRLQNFLKRLLAEEGSKKAFERHVQQMRKMTRDARKSETTPTEAAPGVSLETRLARETTFDWVKRMATHLTQPYTKKSKPVDTEEIKSLRSFYIQQLKQCAQAESLQETAMGLIQSLGKHSPAASPPPAQKTRAVK